MALLPPSLSSSSSSITYSFTFDVFLSFRGSDTRYGFVGNLHKALSHKGIHTFIDDEELQKGNEITPALEEAIEKSRIAIVVLSKNYASSTFCLHELYKILNCFKENCRLIWPIFYDVDPSDVRKQIGTYREAMTSHMERFKYNEEKLQKWRTALQQVADLSGWHFKHGDGYEHEFIQKIVNEASRTISRVALPIADYPVGLESQVRQVILLLDVGSIDRVHMVGIHGTGGIGKTTLALAVYNSIADHFEGLCFLENVRENSNKHGLLHLQKTLLLALLGEKEIEITSVKHGSSIIQHRLQQKKVLLILDDVNEEEQLSDIIGRSDWFGPGSRVIITTRDKHLLACHRVEKTHEVKALKVEDAFELLRWKVFKKDKVSPSYVDILNCVVTYASGLPLALEVIGSNLCGKSIQEWRSALQWYEMIPNKKIQQILRVSFDALEEKEQSVFLDIACCFKGYNLKEVEDILHAHHDQCVKYQIRVLVDKSLLKLHWGKVTLHDLIEDMGKEIVRQESPTELGNRSRLWSHKDIFEVLEGNTGTSKIEIIHLNYLSFEEVDLEEETFKEMKKLKTLIIGKIQFSKAPKILPNSLRVLAWWKYPSQHFPCDFHPKKLSICKLPESSLMSLELLSSSKMFVSMKVLKLKRCEYLTQIPGLSSLPNLEELSFRDCTNLTTMGHSVLSSTTLKILDAGGCTQLRSVPPLKLPSLEHLELSLCSSLESFPEILEKIEDITELNLMWSNITKFSSSFKNLTRLQRLKVTRLPPLRSLVMIPQLAELSIHMPLEGILETQEKGEEKVSSMLLYSNVEYLQLRQCILSDQLLAVVLPWFPHLLELDLRYSEFIIVPECIKQCRFLCKLVLYGCKQLREIEGIPPSLKCLSAIGCESLSFSCRSMLLMQEVHEAGKSDFFLPSLESGRIPEWFEQQSRGPSPSVSFWFRNNFPHNLLLCLALPLPAKMGEFVVTLQLCLAYPLAQKMCLHKKYFNFIVNGKAFIDIGYYGCRQLGGSTHLLNMLPKKIFDYNVDEAHFENEWHHAEVRFVSKKQISSDIGIGIHVLKENTGMEDIRFTNPDCEEYFDCESSLSSTGSDVEENEEDESSV